MVKHTRIPVLLLLAIVVAILIPLSASAYISTGPSTDRTWFWQNPLPQGNDLRSTSWVSTNTGWAVGVTGTAIKTTDGGASWTAEDPGTTRDLTGVSFVDASNGWASGLSGTVQHTSDGGATWVAQTVPAEHAGHNLRSISFFNANVGVAVGDLGTTTSTIIYTTNGGATWKSAATTSTVGLSDAQMVSATKGWAVGGAGVILKTSDGGATWTPVVSPAGGAGLAAVSFAPGGVVGYVVGNAALPNWTIFKTADSGATWAAVSGLGATGAINLTGVSCLDASNTVVVGTNGQIRHTRDGGVTWLNQSQNNLQANALRDVKMIDANNIKTVGDFGVTFFTRNSGEFWFTAMLGTTATYRATSFVDANHGWVVGTNGTIMRTADAGATWETQASGITVWRGVSFTDLNNGWVVGDSGLIEHTSDGINWAPQNSGTTQVLNGVWFTSSTTGFAVGGTGTILKTTDGGATWTAKPSGTTQGLNAVWFANGNRGYAVGNNGVILRSTNGGETWTTQTSGTTQVLLAVQGVSVSQVWAAGNNGVVLTTNNGGSAWSALSAGAGTNPVRTIFFVDANTGWLASNYGIVQKTTDGGTTWTSEAAGMPTSTVDPPTGIYASWFADANTGYLVGDSGTIRRTVNGGAAWTSLQFGTLSNLNVVAFADAVNGWIAGAGGWVMRTSDAGQTWAAQKTGTNNALNCISVLSSQTVWGAGDNGTIRRTNDGGQTWIGQTSGVLYNIKSISAVDSAHAVVCGQGSIKYTANGGSTWATGSVDTTQVLNSVYMADVNNGWAVGTRIAGNNVVYHTANGGATWTTQATSANANLWDVYFRDANVGYATGDSGVILKTTDGGANWIRQSTPTTLPFYWIRFADANNGVAVGGGGVIARTSDGGTTWVLRSSGTAKTLTSVAMLDASRAFVTGTGGIVLRNADVSPPVTTMGTNPIVPNGTNGWFRTNPPVISLVSSKVGTTYYGWSSAAGPFLPYTGSFLAPAGISTLYYYSVDASSNAEAVNSANFKVDFSAPSASGLVTATSVSTSTAQIAWQAATDTVSGVDHYNLYVNGTYALSTATTSASLFGLASNTNYSVALDTVDVAGNVSDTSSTPIFFKTTFVDTSPLTTILNSTPTTPDGADGWYVTTPTVTLAALPMEASSTIMYSWNSPSGPYQNYTTTMTPPGVSSTLYYSAHDPNGVRADETTRQASFKVDTATPATPSVTASATGFASINLSWPAVPDTASLIARYDVYRDGTFLTSTTDPYVDIVGLSPSTSYSFAVYAVNGAGKSSAAAPVSGTTLFAPLPSAPIAVYATAPSGYFALVDWTASSDTLGSVSYHVWRSTDGEHYSVLATTTGGLQGTQYVDSTLSASRHYWYAVSTLDLRGESSLSDTSSAVAPSISTTTTGPQRPSGLAAVESSGSVVLSWAASPNPSTVAYEVLRADSSLGTPSVLTSIPIAATTYFDLTVQNGAPYYYSVVAVDASGTLGSPSLELEARGREIYTDPSPHIIQEDSACICHAVHTSTSPSKLIRFPGATVDTVCDSCHAPATSLGEFLDPQAKSRHALDATVSPEAQFTCNTCHRPLKTSTEPTANLMLTNSVSPCVVVTDTPAGDAFCYTCHGVGSTLPMGDLSGFENSAHSNVTAPPTGAGIKCDACHESHSSRNEDLNKYSGYMMCVECHNSAQSDPNAPDIWSRLTENSAANAKHPLLPQDQVNGARMTCQNCHNTHASTAANPLVNPHNPSPSGVWTTPLSDQKDFCFTCHNGQALPTSQETTPWASAVLASGAATTVADIKDAYAVNVHGFGQRSGATTTTAFLRPDMGYQYGDVLECGSCHDPHGTANSYALLQNVTSANGLKTINGVAVAPVPGGGYDFRFFCGTCHAWDSSTHDSMAGTSTVSFPTNCAACHSHLHNGSPSPNL